MKKSSGRKYDIFEEYPASSAGKKTEDVEKIMVLTGSAAGTAKVVVDKLREAGEKVGILKINLFRPFPHQEIAESLKNAKEIIVLDRAQSIGTYPPFYSEIINSLYGNGRDAKFCVSTGREIKSYIYGLGGRDIFQKQIEDVFMGKIKSKYIQ
ncbi:MAG: Pyruvate synthase subunit PorA [Candidatus Moranbacteria bacterium GW2011_GWF2_35_39]|nr:MAG: Pyruvate synthase subunit PorA [Candidatus Moranbacteria bacterium GW2011_GWF2_35_39]